MRRSELGERNEENKKDYHVLGSLLFLLICNLP